MEAQAGTLVPPLQHAWRSETTLSVAVAGDGVLYGITSAGKMVALNSDDGTRRWESTHTYVPGFLSRQGTRLFAYRLNEGFGWVDDVLPTPVEQLAMSFGASPSASLSTPMADGPLVYYAVNQGLYAYHQTQGLQFGAILGPDVPYTGTLVAPRTLLLIDGTGLPYLYQITDTAFELLWQGQAHGTNTGRLRRTYVVANSQVVIAIGQDLVAYNLSTGRINWRANGVPARALATAGDVVYAGWFGAALWALRASNGSTIWQRQFLYDTGLVQEQGLAAVGDYLYYGGALQTNPDRAVLLSVRAADGDFAWLSRAASGNWAGGIPLTDGTRLYCYNSTHTGAYLTPAQSPRVGAANIAVTPRPLRGPAGSFGQGTVSINLPVSARVSVATYRERQGVGSMVVSGANWGAGPHQTNWTVAGPGGYTDQNQFGYMLVDIAESGGASYTHALLLPVNTFPDTQWHWAGETINIMVYHQFVSGYPDQTFKPDSLVTRAESSTIIAKTLGLPGPSAGFQTKFTDIATHWARSSIMALEERDIIGGFQEPDGRFTFRPDLNMTRAQEARILVRAYAVPAAPSGFATKFRDIQGHWAEADIKALEAAGYVNGYPEPGGSFTYRPEQNLNRAELCALVVRIRNLAR